MFTQLRLLPLLILLLSLGGCSWFSAMGKWFSSDDEEESKDPYPLVKIVQEIELKQLWSTRVGDGVKKRYVRLLPVVSGDRVYAGSVDGRVAAFSVDKGRKIWSRDIRDVYEKAPGSFLGIGDKEDKTDIISAGVGLAGDLILVATTAADLIALNKSDGSLAWKARLSSEVLSAPQSAKDLVIAQSIDGNVTAYDRLNGTRRWVYSSSVPRLTLRGTSEPIVVGDVVICGFANGRVAAIDLERGIPRWEQKVAVATGQSELDRLVDVDGQMVIGGGQLFAASYQGRLVSMEPGTGAIRWQKDASTFVGLGEGFDQVYIADDKSVLRAYDMNSSRELWSVDALTYRGITTPVAVGNYLVVGDVEGHVHVLAQSDGRFVGRKKVDSDRLISPVVVSGGVLFIQGSSGKLTALAID